MTTGLRILRTKLKCQLCRYQAENAFKITHNVHVTSRKRAWATCVVLSWLFKGVYTGVRPGYSFPYHHINSQSVKTGNSVQTLLSIFNILNVLKLVLKRASTSVSTEGFIHSEDENYQCVLRWVKQNSLTHSFNSFSPAVRPLRL